MQVGKFNRIDPAPKQELEAVVLSASPNDGFDFSASGYSKTRNEQPKLQYASTNDDRFNFRARV